MESGCPYRRTKGRREGAGQGLGERPAECSGMRLVSGAWRARIHQRPGGDAVPETWCGVARGSHTRSFFLRIISCCCFLPSHCALCSVGPSLNLSALHFLQSWEGASSSAASRSRPSLIAAGCAQTPWQSWGSCRRTVGATPRTPSAL